jgi:hypothetical protein
MQAYCVKCRSLRDVQHPQSTTTKNGGPAVHGTCPVCGTRLFKIGASL